MTTADRIPSRAEVLATSTARRPFLLAEQLVRTALLAKLAVDLDDGPLARRAAREAGQVARSLAGRAWPAGDPEGAAAFHCGPRVGRLPDLEQVLVRRFPALLDVEVDR